MMNLGLALKTIAMTILYILKVESGHKKRPGLIYILTWTDGVREPFIRWSSSQQSFVSRNCSYQNCFIVKRRDYFQDVLDYDVLLFNPLGMDNTWPEARSDNQLYVLTCTEPAAFLNLGENFNWFFNYTWTYRLDSDVIFPYFYVRNKRGEIVAPKVNARWRSISRMRPTDNSVKEKLQSKSKAAVWFVTNCYAKNNRLAFGHGLNKALLKYNLSVDIYGKCGDKFCPKEQFEKCVELVEKNYYFYLALENSNSEDYITEKVMTAMHHYAVPVIMGGANYSRFIPDGIYLNANILSEEEIATKINELIQNKQKYYDYFRWHRYYTIHRSDEESNTDPLCAFCAFLNDNAIRTKRRTYKNIEKWWNEYRGVNDTVEDFIAKFEDSGPNIKGVLTYAEPKIENKFNAAPTTLDNVNNFFSDLFSYYFQ